MLQRQPNPHPTCFRPKLKACRRIFDRKTKFEIQPFSYETRAKSRIIIPLETKTLYNNPIAVFILLRSPAFHQPKYRKWTTLRNTYIAMNQDRCC